MPLSRCCSCRPFPAFIANPRLFGVCEFRRHLKPTLMAANIVLWVITLSRPTRFVGGTGVVRDPPPL